MAGSIQDLIVPMSLSVCNSLPRDTTYATFVTSEGRLFLDRGIYPDMSRAVLPLTHRADEISPDKTRIQILLQAAQVNQLQGLSHSIIELETIGQELPRVCPCGPISRLCSDATVREGS